ncbi:hypothetical protein GGD87_003216 [Rhodobaca bogoriensis DSM 18756]|nr:hypothetical protein [Rhodobaca bogoriensis DSM 18756]
MIRKGWFYIAVSSVHANKLNLPSVSLNFTTGILAASATSSSVTQLMPMQQPRTDIP